jgi:hypothetical protein
LSAFKGIDVFVSILKTEDNSPVLMSLNNLYIYNSAERRSRALELLALRCAARPAAVVRPPPTTKVQDSVVDLAIVKLVGVEPPTPSSFKKSPSAE